MTFRILHPIALALLLTASLGCASAEDRAGELYDTAQFEEKQFNKEHASELYNEILERYPDTSWAPKATGRLEAILEK